MKLDLSPESRGRVIAITVLGAVFCVAVTLYLDSFNFQTMSEERRLRAIVFDIGLPVALAVPLLLYFTGKLRELAIANKRLLVYASTDSLTHVMNRAAFSTLVDAFLHDVRAGEAKTQGALLIIDADNFKAVNDRYGHDRGDEALITIATAMKAMLRAPDIIGRLGGEEFGVFLPGATTEQAALVAERIRQNVKQAQFAPGGSPYDLSVSVGGAVFKQKLTFADLFRLADEQLYAAKRAGRDQVVIAPIQPGPVSLVAA